MSSVTGFFIPPVSYFGEGALIEAANYIQTKDFKKAIIITDPGIARIGLSGKVTKLLEDRGLSVAIYDQTQPNPNIGNVTAGLKVLKENNSDIVVSIGGGSAHDNAKAIALLATNGGEIGDYEGVNQSKLPALPLVAVNTTAGTASEMTRFTIISNEEKKVKMAIIDNNVTPSVAVNDPSAMYGLPPALTAATGLDALTHCIEAYVSTAASPITDCCALKGIDLIEESLAEAYKNGSDKKARTDMCYAEYLAGMAFNNASLGYVHAIAHQLGGFYHLPHGVCNAVLLPHVQSFNMKCEKTNKRLAEIATHLGEKEASADATIARLHRFNRDLNIPRNLKELGVKEEDFEILAENAMQDACHLTNPIQFKKEEVIAIIRQAFEY
ncbi:LANO_0G15412g1_1 [Lachancea nothofagi CBS 11611]|uniref:Alcohol dehydrogenase 4 n=1 Tax=Lachancea nothofagi CBS 11611 TaxID=1266666 RepID=A0A1G4KKM6_9SACH|nr:LANO_0G15412g1_1 [Lachancea nothofagi CBS 11611]